MESSFVIKHENCIATSSNTGNNLSEKEWFALFSRRKRRRSRTKADSRTGEIVSRRARNTARSAMRGLYAWSQVGCEMRRETEARETTRDRGERGKTVKSRGREDREQRERI
jgi:hypothetical protein